MAYKDKEKAKANWRAYYMANRERKKASSRTYAQTHREEQRAYAHSYYQANLSERKTKARVNYYAHRKEIIAKQRVRDQLLMAEALRVLGSKCACPGCGISEPRFLTIDHIHGRSKGVKKQALEEARASRWDKTKFQILCWNCNMTKRDRGFCPVHQTASEARNGHSYGANTQQALWPLSR